MASLMEKNLPPASSLKLGELRARVLLMQGWYIIAYGLCLYLLSMFIQFLTPFEEDNPSQSQAGDEFHPFIRKLPEFKFWVSFSRAILISLFLTYFSIFNIPVFWPILVLYFILLFVVTMRRQIMHMIEHKYIPFSIGKKKYVRKQPMSLPQTRDDSSPTPPTEQPVITSSTSLLPPPLTTPTFLSHGDVFSMR